MTAPRHRFLALLACLLAVLGARAGSAPGKLLVLHPDRPIELLPTPAGAVPAAMAREVLPDESPPPLWRLAPGGDGLVLEPAGSLPPATLAAFLLPSPRPGPPLVVASCRGRLVLVEPREEGSTFTTLAASPWLAATRVDVIGRGSGGVDLLAPTWAGALWLRGTAPGRWTAPSWLPLPRSATVGPGAIHVRAARWPTPRGDRPPTVLWAEDHVEGTIAVYRGTPAARATATPPHDPPPLVARARLPGRFRWAGREALLPGRPGQADLVVRLLGWPRDRGPRAPGRLIALPLLPRRDGLAADPVLDAELPLRTVESSPLLDLADADRDGTTDILVGGLPRRGSHRVAVFLFRGEAASRFAREGLAWTARVGKEPALLALRDLDGDGVPDVLASARGVLSFWRGRREAEDGVPWTAKPTATWSLPGRDLRGAAPVVVVKTPGERLLVMPLLPRREGPLLFVGAALPREAGKPQGQGDVLRGRSVPSLPEPSVPSPAEFFAATR